LASGTSSIATITACSSSTGKGCQSRI
jgi:hypothetical protein